MRMIWLMGAAMACAAALNSPAMAQTATETPQGNETVEVIAPYVVRQEPATPRRGPNREYWSLIKVDRSVSFADLDLAKPEDQATLQGRVKQAAQDSCKNLEQRFPSRLHGEAPRNQNCVKDATDEAMIQVNELIAAANTK